MRTGEALNRLVAAYGIDTVFGIAGVHNIELFRGFAAAGLRLIRPRHEQGAGFMADGYARASGRTAACYVITGPGLTNLMTPLAQAYSDSVPVIAIAATLPRGSVPRSHHCGAATASASKRCAAPCRRMPSSRAT